MISQPDIGKSPRVPLFSVIILNWNGRALLEECIDSVLGQTIDDYETVIADNGSTDGSVDYVRERYGDRVRIIALPDNRGYVGAYNVAIPQTRGEWVILLNNDTRVETDWLEACAEAVRNHPEAGMFTPKILEYDHPDVIDNTGHVMYADGMSRGRSRLEKDDGRFDADEEVFYPSGCAGVYNRKMLERIGLFDERFFAFGEDTDLGLRGRVAGYPCWFVAKAKLYHKYSATWGKYSPGKVFFVERNRFWILLKYFPVREILLSPAFTMWRYIAHFRGILKKQGATYRFTESTSSWKLFFTVLKAEFSALAGLPHILSDRYRFRKTRVLSGAAFRDQLRRFAMTAEEVALKD
ncbi:MAG TPA: glycosyltransferase family 2 protein [Candidatus Deferrimicrobiaceae bacterium]